MATGETIQLPCVRLSFPVLSDPKAFEEGQEKRREASFLLDPSHPVHAKVIEQIKASAKALVKEVCKGKVPTDVVYCFGPGSDKEYDGYEDMFYIASNKKAREGRVTIIDKDGNPLHGPDDDSWPYAGCYVDATISLWSQNHKTYGRKVNANLRAIRFRKDGEGFSSIKPVDVDSEFDGMDNDGDEFGDFGGDEAADPLA